MIEDVKSEGNRDGEQPKYWGGCIDCMSYLLDQALEHMFLQNYDNSAEDRLQSSFYPLQSNGKRQVESGD